MNYAVLGRTGLRVSRLGFGAMRLPMAGAHVDRDKAIPLIRRAFELGVNYIDTAVFYCNSESQAVIGEALKGWRDRIVVSTKNHHYNRSSDAPWWRNLEDSLRLLDVEWIDVYNFHGLTWKNFEAHLAGAGGQLEWMHKARDQGLIRHIGFSFHDKPEALVKLAATGELESVTLQYNLLDRSNEPALGACRKANMGVVVMGPVGGGRLAQPSDALRNILPAARSVPEVALRFVLANPNVTVALSGMSAVEQVEENVRTAGRKAPLSAAEKRRVAAALARFKKLADLYCTGCNYCMPCPHGVDIPGNFTLLNYVRVYGLPEAARQRYHWVRGQAIKCLACGACLEKCPQHIDIIGQLRETVRTLDATYGKVLVTVTPTQALKLARRGAAVNLDLACRLECRNISDVDADPGVGFAPAENVTVELARHIGRLAAFGRRTIPMTVRVRELADGEPIRLGPLVDGPLEMVYTPEPLLAAVALAAGRKSATVSLAKAPAVRAEQVAPVAGRQGPAKPSPRALADHALAARFAHTAEALTVQLDARGPLPRRLTARRPMRDSDHFSIQLDLADAQGFSSAGPGGKADRPRSFEIHIAPPAKSGDRPTVECHRPPLKPEELAGVKAEWASRGNGHRLLVRIPWQVLQVAPPKAGAALGLNFALICQAARPNAAWQLTWAHKGKPRLLLA